MSHPQSHELQKIIDDWQYFAPCLGANITVYDSNYGYTNFSSGLKSINPEKQLTSQEQFYIYSITKTFTAILVMQLVEKKLVTLNAPITKYLKIIKLPNEVTVAHLLNHNSGVPNYTDLTNYLSENRAKPSDPWSFEYVIEKTCNGELDFSPGEQWHYSNTGYMLLLLMIESITNKTFSKNVKELIIDRIGLKNTYVAEDIDNNITNGYCRYLNDKREMKNIKDVYNPWWCKTGLIVSTSLEITKLYHALFSGQLVSKVSLSEMTKPIPIGQDAGPHFKKPSYGFGLMIDLDNTYGASYGHGGDGAGFNTWSVYYPDFNGKTIGVTVFCNTSMTGHPFFLVNEVLEKLKNV